MKKEEKEKNKKRNMQKKKQGGNGGKQEKWGGKCDKKGKSMIKWRKGHFGFRGTNKFLEGGGKK